MKKTKLNKVNLVISIINAVLWSASALKSMTGWPYGYKAATDTIVVYSILAVVNTLAAICIIAGYIKSSKNDEVQM